MTKNTRWILTTAIILIFISIAVLFFYSYSSTKSTYSIVDVDHTTLSASEFKESELVLFDSGTFHIEIKHSTDGLIFIGIGKYVESGGDYTFRFTSVYGKDGGILTDQMHKFNNDVTYHKEKQGIKFIDHSSQVYYFS